MCRMVSIKLGASEISCTADTRIFAQLSVPVLAMPCMTSSEVRVNMKQIKVWDDDTISDDFLGEKEVDLDMQVCLRMNTRNSSPEIQITQDTICRIWKPICRLSSTWSREER